MSDKLQQQDFFGMESNQMSLQVDSPAKTLAPRTPAPKGLMVQGADSSSSCSESSVRLDQLGLSLRTHLRCALEAQTGYSMNWKDKGTPAGRSWWVLGMS